MNVGDFVRTKKGKIGKIINYIDEPTDYYFNCYETDLKNSFSDKYITEYDNEIKSSPQIIDLIEVGDYVNGTIVTKVVLDSIECNYIELDYSYNKRGIRNKDIKTIITHEQMEAMQYRVEE